MSRWLLWDCCSQRVEIPTKSPVWHPHLGLTWIGDHFHCQTMKSQIARKLLGRTLATFPVRHKVWTLLLCCTTEINREADTAGRLLTTCLFDCKYKPTSSLYCCAVDIDIDIVDIDIAVLLLIIRPIAVFSRLHKLPRWIPAVELSKAFDFFWSYCYSLCCTFMATEYKKNILDIVFCCSNLSLELLESWTRFSGFKTFPFLVLIPPPPNVLLQEFYQTKTIYKLILKVVVAAAGHLHLHQQLARAQCYSPQLHDLVSNKEVRLLLDFVKFPLRSCKHIFPEQSQIETFLSTCTRMPVAWSNLNRCSSTEKTFFESVNGNLEAWCALPAPHSLGEDLQKIPLYRWHREGLPKKSS